MVIWLLGISGAGKTTLGNELHKYLQNKNINSFVIDGDLVRDFYDNDLGYDKKDRVANIKRILLSAYILEENNIIPIVCNISPFEELREFARNKLKDYREVYLQKDINTAQLDDIKKIYINNTSKTPLIGIDIIFEEPKNSDLIINVDQETVNESLNKILDNILKKDNRNI